MAELYEGQAKEHWEKLLESCFVLGYFKGELKSKGYTEEQVKKLEQDAIEAYNKNWKV